jgi:hypothetical protein
MLRAVLPIATQGLAPSAWAIILKFAAGSVALLGSYHAVSGATNIVPPYSVKATVGIKLTRQLGTSGQTAHSWSASTAPDKSAVYPLTPGLYLTNATGKIGGIPTWAGTSNIVIKAWELVNNAGASVSATFVFTITNGAATLPAITQQPQSQTVIAGQTASFAVTATGTAPLTYFWRKGATVVQAGSAASYALARALASDAGTFSVIVSNSVGIATSAEAVLTVNAAVTPPTITQQPQNQIVTAGQAASFSVAATGSGPLTYFWRQGATVIQAGTNASYALARALTSDAGTFSVIVSNSVGIATSAEAVLTVNAPQESIRPKLTVSSPLAAYLSVPSNSIILRGLAADASGIAGVFVQRGAEPQLQALGTTNWAATVPLLPGSNVFRIKAVDLAGNTSPTNSRTVFHSVTNRLTLASSGSGRISGASNGQALVCGRARKLTAVPAAGWLFSNWVGSASSTNPIITFLMASNTTLTANFVPNPFLKLGGTYTGLFFDTSLPAHESSGFFSLSLAGNGAYSAKLTTPKRTLLGTGKFGLDLHARIIFAALRTNPPVALDLQLAAGSDEIHGIINDTVRAIDLFGYRAAYGASNRATNFAGAYTLSLPGSRIAANEPPGHGGLTLSASTLGSLILAGNLADGTPIAQARSLAANGALPFHSLIYLNRGSALGWLTLAVTETNDVHGRLLWTKRPGVAGPVFPAGFEKTIDVTGSRYTAPPVGTRTLNLTNGACVLSGGGLDLPLSLDATLSAANRLTVTNNTNRVVLLINRLNGLMTGSFLNPATRKASTLKGVVLQKQNCGAGYLVGTNQTGAVLLKATQPNP